MEEQKTVKRQIIENVHRLPDDLDYDRAIEGIQLLQKVGIALVQIERGEVYDDEEVAA